MLKFNIPNPEAIRNWCNEKFQPKGNYITKSEISNEVNETNIELLNLTETVPESITAMSEEKKLKNLLSHMKAFMTGSKALIDLCITTGMITQQNIDEENKVPSAALLYSLNNALNGKIEQINSNLNNKGDINNLPYGFRDLNQVLWGVTPSTSIDNADFGLMVTGAPSGYAGDAWYYLTFYEGGNTNKRFGVQLAMARAATVTVLFRNRNSGVWSSWKQL